MEPRFRYPERTYGNGQLFYAGSVPVLRVGGTPEELGRQTAELALLPARRLLEYPLDLLTARLGSRVLARLLLPLVDRLARRLVRRFPEHHRRELQALSQGVGDERRVIRANTLFDLKNLRPWRLQTSDR